MKLRIIIWSIVACLLALFIAVFSNWEKAQVRYYLSRIGLLGETSFNEELLGLREDGAAVFDIVDVLAENIDLRGPVWGIGDVLDANPKLVDYIVKKLKSTNNPWHKAMLIDLLSPYANRAEVFPILTDSLKSNSTVIRFTTVEAIHDAFIDNRFSEEQQRILVETLEELMSVVKKEEEEKLFRIKLVKEFIKSGGDRQLVCNILYEHYLRTRGEDSSSTSSLDGK